ncbi:MAG: UPF0147 family protein [Nanoarchaeota archaeon]
MNDRFGEAVSRLEELKEEFRSNKKMKEKIDAAISILNKGEYLSVEKALNELEELNSLNLASYHRTLVWDVVSFLETLKD